eukprot:12920674-Prorocentrum_lima.AAC.1
MRTYLASIFVWETPDFLLSEGRASVGMKVKAAMRASWRCIWIGESVPGCNQLERRVRPAR